MASKGYNISAIVIITIIVIAVLIILAFTVCKDVKYQPFKDLIVYNNRSYVYTTLINGEKFSAGKGQCFALFDNNYQFLSLNSYETPSVFENSYVRVSYIPVSTPPFAYEYSNYISSRVSVPIFTFPSQTTLVGPGTFFDADGNLTSAIFTLNFPDDSTITLTGVDRNAVVVYSQIISFTVFSDN